MLFLTLLYPLKYLQLGCKIIVVDGGRQSKMWDAIMSPRKGTCFWCTRGEIFSPQFNTVIYSSGLQCWTVFIFHSKWSNWAVGGGLGKLLQYFWKTLLPCFQFPWFHANDHIPFQTCSLFNILVVWRRAKLFLEDQIIHAVSDFTPA